MSVDVAVKYGIDLSNVRRVEDLYGQQLPDLLEPLRQADADVDQLKASLAEYRQIADDLDGLRVDLVQVRAGITWSGEAGLSASGAIDGVLTVLAWIGAIILFIVAALLALLAGLLYAIGAILTYIADVLSWLGGIIAVVVTIVVLIRSGGRGAGNVGRLQAIWAAITTVFNLGFMVVAGTIGNICEGFGWVATQCAKAIMWLALYLIEVGARWTDSPDSDIKDLQRERRKIYD